ncbi:MAG: hypothetical protein IT322_08265 [Anaerolineae bacterium]|nr:hypothetical protein [Anaerolineae bacterium]CAG1008577.1 hypothetical protein ANRL4_03906 [Anaerolineae bacterium]
MDEQNFEYTIREDTQIVVELINGDLIVEGVSGRVLNVSSESEDGLSVRMDDDGRVIVIKSEEDCRISLPKVERLAIRQVDGDCTLRGLAAEVVIEEIGSDLTLNDVAGPVTIREIGSDGRLVDVAGPCRLESVGSDLQARDIAGPLHIGSIGSDARIVDVAGPVTIDNQVGSDLVLRDIMGPVTLASVGSDLEIKRVMGPVQVESIGSDATFREVQGPLQIGSVGSDCSIAEISGPLHIDSVGSDLVFEIALDEGSGHHVGSVGSDVLGKIRSGSRVRFNIPANVERTVKVPSTKMIEEGNRVLVVVGGAAAEGPVFHVGSIGSEFQLVQGRSSGFEFEFDFDRLIPENLEEMIAKRVSEAMSHLQENFARQSERMKENAERARARAEAAAERARAKAERQGEKAKQHGFRFGFGPFPVPPAPPTPPGAPVPPRRPVEPVTDAERLMILRMVEAKQISIEEAERLLAALEGRLG